MQRVTNNRYSFLWAALITLILSTTGSADPVEQRVAVVVPAREVPRITYGVNQLKNALQEVGLAIAEPSLPRNPQSETTITVGVIDNDPTTALGATPPARAESFTILSPRPKQYVITGRDESGAMYGCLELGERIRRGKKLPALPNPISQGPALRLRQSCVYMCLPKGSRDGGFYDFLWTPENFPWFYDKEHWQEHLDLLARSRFNALVLWAGHPFTSILQLPNYPEAQELSDADLQRNIEMFRWVTQEAERRGIWTVVHFYNIRISHSLAKAHNISIGQSKPTELNRNYTRHCVSEFIRNYPHVGLMVCLGEYLLSEYDAEWLADVIIDGVKDSLRPGQEEPPLIIRSHDCPMSEVLERASYSNLFTTSKYSSEALISHVVGGGPGNKDIMSWKFSKDLSEQNPHILELMFISNLQPCQYGSPRFARGALSSCVDIGSQGVLHFPLAYLNWPYTTHATSSPIRQIDRDWMWYESWGRAAWNPHVPDDEARSYWHWRLGEIYGVPPNASAVILEASEAVAEVMPHVTRALSNQPWNIQTHMLGQTMEQTLTISGRWYAPLGETLIQYAQKELAGAEHQGETPLEAAEQIQSNAATALLKAKQTRSLVTRNQEAYDLWVKDIKITKLVGDFYAQKARAAISTHIYFQTRDNAQLESIEQDLESSLSTYRQLAEFTDGLYATVGGWDAAQQIPFRPPITHWKQALPRFEQELKRFQTNARDLRRDPLTSGQIKPYSSVDVEIHTDGCESFEMKLNARPYTTNTPWVHQLLPELRGLTGIRFSSEAAEANELSIEFELKEPARVFVGFAGQPEYRVPGRWAKPTEDWKLYANESAYLYKWHEYYMARCDVYVKEFPAGRSVLSFGQGAFTVLGCAAMDSPLVPRAHRVVQPGLWFSHNQSGSGEEKN